MYSTQTLPHRIAIRYNQPGASNLHRDQGWIVKVKKNDATVVKIALFDRHLGLFK